MPEERLRPPSVYMLSIVDGGIVGEKRMPAVLSGHVGVTSEQRKEYVTARAQYKQQGGKGKITWDGEKPIVPLVTPNELRARAKRRADSLAGKDPGDNS